MSERSEQVEAREPEQPVEPADGWKPVLHDCIRVLQQVSNGRVHYPAVEGVLKNARNFLAGLEGEEVPPQEDA